MKITEGMKVCDILNMDDRLEEVFEKHGMLCLGCPGAASETLKEAAEGHGLIRRWKIYLLMNICLALMAFSLKYIYTLYLMLNMD